MISIVMSHIACLSQHFNVMISYHVGDVCKQCNHPMLLTTGDVGGQMSPNHFYIYIYQMVHALINRLILIMST